MGNELMRIFAAICIALVLWGAAALAQMQSQIVWDANLAQQTAGSVWNPSDKDAAITLSQTTLANDTATQAGAGSAFKGVRGTQSYATSTDNKVIFAIKVVTTDNSAGWVGGVGDLSVGLVYPGSASHGFGVQADHTTTGSTGDYQDGTSHTPATSVCAGSGGGTQPRFQTGGMLWIAVDFNTGKLWCTNDCTQVTWLSNGNPDAGTNQAYTRTAATYVPMWGGFDAAGPADVAQLITNPVFSGCPLVTTFKKWG